MNTSSQSEISHEVLGGIASLEANFQWQEMAVCGYPKKARLQLERLKIVHECCLVILNVHHRTIALY
jgi:hypothetical protein